ncbi:MAG: cobalamin-binding protein [Candidatus Dactylopiibacterium sp.]|nr:cobalamin-binding protein [Candidatus Dactylopiibacterium sp.]
MTHRLLALALAFGTALAHAAPISVRDDAGATLTLARPAQRIVTLAPSLAEMLFEAGAGDRLVGAVAYTDFPAAARQAPRVGSNQKLDLERIAALRPDLVLVWFHGNAQREVERLRALRIPMFLVEPRDIPDVADAIERIGALAGTLPVARGAAERFRARHAALRQRYGERPTVRVFYQVSQRPLLTINDSQIISDVIRQCGGSNVFGQEPMLVPHLSTESVVAANPDVILTARMGGGGNAIERGMDDPTLADWLQFGSLKAVRNRQLWRIPGDVISRHGPRILDAMQFVCDALDAARSGR